MPRHALASVLLVVTGNARPEQLALGYFAVGELGLGTGRCNNKGMVLPRPEGVAYENYRTGRRNMLEACCRVLKAMRPEAQDIVGIATEQGSVEERSEDAVYLDAREWSEKDQARALELQDEWDLLNDVSGYAIRVQEYPDPSDGVLTSAPSGTVRTKGRNRNSPCPCGSGRKFKKCCGSS